MSGIKHCISIVKRCFFKSANNVITPKSPYSFNLTGLSNVNTPSPSTDDVLKYDGVRWINGEPPGGGSGGIVGGLLSLYQDDTAIIATGTNNVIEVNTLSSSPQGGSEDADTIACNNNTVIGEAYYYNTPINIISIPAGTWVFNTYAAVDSTLANRVSTITRNVYLVKDNAGTIETTGSGTSRTATASTGTPFVTGDADAASTDSGYLMTPQGLYQITAFTSGTVVTISTPITYVNEAAVSYNVWKKKIGITTDTITNTGTNYGLYSPESVETAISSAITDTLGEIVFGTSNKATNITWTHNGTARYSHFHTTILDPEANLNISNWIPLTEDTHWDDQPASSSTITMATDLTGVIKVGMPIRFMLGNGATNAGTYYAVCTAITSNLLTIAGPPLETDDGDLTALAIDKTRQPIQLDFYVADTYADGADATLLASDMDTYFKWQERKAYLVSFSCVQKTVDSGTEPKINVMVNSAAVSTNDSNNGVQLGASATWVDNSAVEINTSNYDINKDESIEINCTVAGGTGDAEDLTVSCVLIQE